MKFNLIENINEQIVSLKIEEANAIDYNSENERFALRRIFSFMDYTTLEGADNQDKVKELCRKALSFGDKGLPMPAAVCIYPPFVATAKKALSGSPVKVAVTAGAFPSGQLPLHLKLAEIDYVVGEGADEVDIVISRGTFLAREYETVFDEISAMRNRCPEAILKVILETGELKSVENIAKASEIAIYAGADFIKTSTGKITPAATAEAATAMLLVIAGYFRQTGRHIGLKPAGGIADPATALMYYKLVSHIAGSDWINASLFRIGASRLADKLSDCLT